MTPSHSNSGEPPRGRDEKIRARAQHEDIFVALALGRAALRALMATSEAAYAAVVSALDDELTRAQDAGEPLSVLHRLAQVREELMIDADEAAATARLEAALIRAAEDLDM